MAAKARSTLWGPAQAEEAQRGRGLWERGEGGGATSHTSDSPVLGTVPGTQWALGKYCVDSDTFYHQIWADSCVIGALGMLLHLVT